MELVECRTYATIYIYVFTFNNKYKAVICEPPNNPWVSNVMFESIHSLDQYITNYHGLTGVVCY